jgi:uncharacterized protein (DUF427 family)
MSEERASGGNPPESVWDYPRPPRLERSLSRTLVVLAGESIAETGGAFRVLETSHPPTWYISPWDVRTELLIPTERRSLCEWKGAALLDGAGRRAGGGRRRLELSRPTPAFAPIRDFLAFYPGLMDACYVDGAGVRAQPGDFYGGWITPDLRGPFKGLPGTAHW